ncbi:helix-turn-helix domain-containing protein [Halobacteriaceae archaeon GCM10025711]
MCVYGDDGGYRSFERTLDERPEVGTWRELARRADRRIYQVDWTDGLGPVFDTLDDVGGLVRSIWSARGRASFEAQFPDHADVSAFYDRCADSGVDLEVTKLEQAGRTAGDDYGLTPEQRETLLAAYEAGYYEIPRDITAVELADELGVSDQSLSERLRRAHANLVEATIE